MTDSPMHGGTRREFFKRAATAGAMVALDPLQAAAQSLKDKAAGVPNANHAPGLDEPYRRYQNEQLNRIAFPMGGIGAGMICLEGTGALSHVSLRNRPDVYNEPNMHAIIAITGSTPSARVLEGPVPSWKIFGPRDSGVGELALECGLPRFSNATFTTRFPFATVQLSDPLMPIDVFVTGWSPFVPGDADSSSLPVAGLEYRFVNGSQTAVSANFVFTAPQVLREITEHHGYEPADSQESIQHDHPTAAATPDGFVMGRLGGFFMASVNEPGVETYPSAGEWHDENGSAVYEKGTGKQDWSTARTATLSVAFTVPAGGEKTIALRLAWYVPKSLLRMAGRGSTGSDTATGSTIPPVSSAEAKVVTDAAGTYQPWYAGRFSDWSAVSTFWREQYADLRQRTKDFTDCFYDSTLPRVATEAVASGLSIFKSPTMLRQTDGRLWLWEGTGDTSGWCEGSCTHVWNYAQATAHLFPELERTLRETEFQISQDASGNQMFRTAIPIRQIPGDHKPEAAAADGQLGGIIKVYREWRISADTVWLHGLWPLVRKSLDYSIDRWDPKHEGWVSAAAHNTYDTEFVGPTSYCTSLYLGALRAAVLMGQALPDDVTRYQQLYDAGIKRTEEQLFNGEYFFHLVDPQVVKQAGGAQYGTGCLTDGLMGAWLAMVCGVGQTLDVQKVKSHVTAVYQHNYKVSLSAHANLQRSSYAVGDEGGTLICTWPKGDRPDPAFPYCDEVWTGVEYQIASHLMLLGLAAKGLDIVGACRRRYDGRVRNPFAEYEAGQWYGRALSSYALLQGLSGARYDAVDKVMYIAPSVPGDFRSFIATATGFGTVGVFSGQPFVEARAGIIEVKDFKYTPADATTILPGSTPSSDL